MADIPLQVTRELIKYEMFAVREHKEGTTTDSYANALVFDCQAFKTKSIYLKNTHASNALLFKVLAYHAAHDKAGVQRTLVAETQLSAGEDTDFIYERAYSRIVIQVKAASAGSQATYSLDYSGLPV